MRSSSVWAARGARWGAGAPGMTGMGAGEGCKWGRIMEMLLSCRQALMPGWPMYRLQG